MNDSRETRTITLNGETFNVSPETAKAYGELFDKAAKLDRRSLPGEIIAYALVIALAVPAVVALIRLAMTIGGNN